MISNYVEEHKRAIKVIRDVADDFLGCKFMPDYSGRGMYGRLCCAIVCPYPITIIEECARKGVAGAKVDNMGKDQVVYWPDLSISQFKGDK